MPDPLKPGSGLLCKLGSIAVHAEETIVTGESFDAAALRGVLADSEVSEWLGEMNDLALLPVKREPT